MDAATLKPVPDSKDKGTSFLPSAGTQKGWLTGGDSSKLESPTAAINSGKKLDGSILNLSQSISNGAGSLYEGKPDNNADDRPLSAKGNGGTATRASNE